MSVLLLLAVLVALFATAWWSGHNLARHHGDGREVAAVAVVGMVALAGIWVTTILAGGLAGYPALGLAGAGCGGLFAGYIRAEPTG